MRFELRPGVRRLFRLAPRDGARPRDAVGAAIDDELEALIANRVDSLVARGVTPADARAEALHRLGASVVEARRQLHQSAHQRERRMRFREWIETVGQDLRYAARGLARRPGFTIVAVATLAVGIGATTAIFSAVNVLLLRPLPYAHPGELMSVSLVSPSAPGRAGSRDMVWSYPKFRLFRDAQRVYADLALYSTSQFTVSATDPERVPGELVGARYLRVLGLTPFRGRDFEPSVDSAAGSVRQAILGYGLWNRRFNADPAVVGTTVVIDRAPYRVVGIGPRFFRGLSGKADLFLPITSRPAEDLAEAQSHEYWMVARRAPGISEAQAAAQVELLGARIDAAVPDEGGRENRWGAAARPLDAERLAPAVKRSLLVLFGAVAVVLLIACVNVASLLLGRASARRREIAVRLSIGAGRARLVRLLLTESMLLALIGGAASVGVAWAGVRALGTIDPATTLRVSADSGLGAMAFSSITLDRTALAFTFGVALLVGAAFGLVPALHASRASIGGALKDAPAPGSRGRRALVVTEVALAIVLLAGSGLMLRSLARLLAIDPGFDGRGVLTFRFTAPPGAIARDSMPGFYAQLEARLRAIPGATDVGLGNCPPLNEGCNRTRLRRIDRPGALRDGQEVGVYWATPTWFTTLRIPLLAGRLFTGADRAGMPRVVVVNDAAARAIWPGESPIGKHVQIGQGGMDDAEVVGVVGGVRQRTDSAPTPEVYVSYAQSPRAGLIGFIRTDRDPAALGDEVRRAVREIAPLIPLYDVRTMEERSAGATAAARFSATLLALFAFTALALAAIGIYGVMSLAVTARRRELGIRLALGADRARVQRLVIGEGAVLAGSGAAIGLLAAVLATRVLRTMLYDLAPTDPATYGAVVVVLGATTLAATWLPARRAARVDPADALRAD